MAENIKRKPKVRDVDYSLDELVKMTGLTRKQFTDRLTRMCEIYKFDPKIFKVYPDEDDSIYFFPPETAEYVAILVKGIDKHPLYKRKAKKTDMTSTQVAEFNKAILSDVDGMVCQSIKEIIYNRDGHLVAQRISDWAEPMVKQLTRFIVNLATLETEDVGAALSMFTKRVDEMNYCLFRGDYLKKYQISSNQKALHQEYDDNVMRIEHLLNDSNVGIDTIIATLLKANISEATDIKKNGYPATLRSLLMKQGMLKMIGVRNLMLDGDIDSLRADSSIENERRIYLKNFISNEDCHRVYSQREFIIQHHREQVPKWRASDVRISNGEYIDPTETTVEDTRKQVEERIAAYENEIVDLKNKLKQLEKRKNDEVSTLGRELQDKYVKHCGEIDKGYTELFEITNRFVGQALNEFLS